MKGELKMEKLLSQSRKHLKICNNKDTYLSEFTTNTIRGTVAGWVECIFESSGIVSRKGLITSCWNFSSALNTFGLNLQR
jgi:hypothetical protein